VENQIKIEGVKKMKQTILEWGEKATSLPVASQDSFEAKRDY